MWAIDGDIYAWHCSYSTWKTAGGAAESPSGLASSIQKRAAVCADLYGGGSCLKQDIAAESQGKLDMVMHEVRPGTNSSFVIVDAVRRTYQSTI